MGDSMPHSKALRRMKQRNGVDAPKRYATATSFRSALEVRLRQLGAFYDELGF